MLFVNVSYRAPYGRCFETRIPVQCMIPSPTLAGQIVAKHSYGVSGGGGGGSHPSIHHMLLCSCIVICATHRYVGMIDLMDGFVALPPTAVTEDG